MKYFRFYLGPGSPGYFKRGAEVGAAAVTGGTSLLDSFLSYESSRQNVNKQIAFQREENQLNRDYQTAEAEKARQYNTAERVASQDWQKQMVDYYNEYNQPVHQAARLREAGLNPSIAMGDNNVQSVSASSSPSTPGSSPSPGPVGGLSPVPQQPFSLNVPGVLNAIGSFYSNIANAEKQGVETDYLRKSMDLNIQGLQNDVSLKELAVVGLKLDNMVKDSVKEVKVRQAFDEASKAYYDAIVSQMTVGKVENETKLLQSQEKLNEALQDYHGANAQIIKLDIANYTKRLNSALNLQKAQSNAANASAEASRAQAADSEQAARFKKFDNDLREKFDADVADTYISELRKNGMMNDRDYEDAKRQLQLMRRVRGRVPGEMFDDFLEYVKDKAKIF